MTESSFKNLKTIESKTKRGCNTPLVIGICGGQWGDGGVGKTTVANIIAKSIGFYPASFVDPVKQLAKEFFGWDGKMDDKARILLDGVCRVGRRISENYWLDLTVTRIPKDGTIEKIVFDDVWFPNEAVWISDCGGVVFMVTRPGHTNPSLPCETVEISNDGSLSSLQHLAPLIIQDELAKRTLR